VINVPPRGVGEVTLQKIVHEAQGRSLLVALREMAGMGAFSSKTQEALTAFVEHIARLTEEAQEGEVEPLVETLLEETGYREYVQQSDEKDFRTRLEVVDEFVSACTQYNERRPEGRLADFLQDLSLMSDSDGLDPDAPQLKLLTCHSAKGLEFDYVYLIGLEEGLLPHAASLDAEEDIEEERRLCYVAMTRARRGLVLTAAESRLIYGDRRAQSVSRFVDEIPAEQLVRVGRGPSGAAKKSAGTTGAAQRADTSQLTVGTRVRHAKFGRGVVMYTAGSGAKLKVKIRFETGIARQFMVSAAPIEILEGKKR
jgi:DNA helicase-2/ATP-dependent DNA helicase PcrA